MDANGSCMNVLVSSNVVVDINRRTEDSEEAFVVDDDAKVTIVSNLQ